ncbi:MAG: hypothetical protein ACD_46C00154G0001, partial [uncultured bacterium]
MHNKNNDKDVGSMAAAKVVVRSK